MEEEEEEEDKGKPNKIKHDVSINNSETIMKHVKMKRKTFCF